MADLKAIWRGGRKILRTEGLGGFWARLRHRKSSGRMLSGAPELVLPLQLKGAFPALEQAFGEAPLKGLAAASGPTLFEVDPAPGTRAAVLFFTGSAVFSAWRTQGGAALPGQTLLLPDESCLREALAAGIAAGQLVLVPWSGAAERTGEAEAHLRAGLVRWLVAAGALRAAGLDPMIFPELAALLPGEGLCLSLPEAQSRRAAFRAHRLRGIRFFPGLRLAPGWQGAAESYRLIARAALARGAVPLMVCEDDMQPGPDFALRLEKIRAELAQQQDWDVFSGLVSNLSEEARILAVQEFGGQKLITLTFTTGMVLNIYGERALQHLAAWQAAAGGLRGNTIDDWLGQMPDLRVITTLPFLAGHDSDHRSTIFGFSNRRYDRVIAASEARLAALVAGFEAAERHGDGGKGS